MGGIGAGMICLEGTGSLTSFSLRNRPDFLKQPVTFAALAIRGEHTVARVLEGPVPRWKLYGRPGCARGCQGSAYGLPRFESAQFSSRFPFGTVDLNDPQIPLKASLTGWSPFIPGDADNSSLPVAALEYRFHNPTAEAVEAVFSFSSGDASGKFITPAPGGFALKDPHKEGGFIAAVSDPETKVNHAWFDGSWFDPLTMAWKEIAQGASFDRPPPKAGFVGCRGATLFVPFRLEPGQEKTITVRLSWYYPDSDLRGDPQGPSYRPWYAGRFADVNAVDSYWRAEYDSLRTRTSTFTNCFYNTTLPVEAVEAVAANLSIFKSPTMLRQTDGRLWLWEGCNDDNGSCAGSCTHVWNYAQATAHLFPDLECTLRDTEFGPSQNAEGCQAYRSWLPIQAPDQFEPAADGQLGGIIKVYRDWRISGDTDWLRGLWPRIRSSLDYCIRTWDPNRKGWLETPQPNTYDIEFWGPTGMITSIYLGALQAMILMGKALGENVSEYSDLLKQGTQRTETELFNGEYFVQKIDREAATAHARQMQPDERDLFEQEGPKYQYGSGCLSDGVIGSWLALVCGVGPVLDQAKVKSHVSAVYRHNLKHDLSDHVNTQRPGFALGKEGGLLLCTWPKGGKLSLPFPYSDEVWTGIEYQVASHLMLLGKVDEGLEIVRTARARYDGRFRNPFDEFECGHWYGRALSSYSLLQGLSGARYDAVDKILHLQPSVKGDFRAFLSTATGFGTVGVSSGQPFLEVKTGKIDVRKIDYIPAG
jgi:uncharacterized protein (DUF608 family)